MSRKPTVDDVTDSELESNFDFKDSEVASEEEMESGDEDITLKVLKQSGPIESTMPSSVTKQLHGNIRSCGEGLISYLSDSIHR